MSSVMRLAALTGSLVFTALIAGITPKVERDAQQQIKQPLCPLSRSALIKVTTLAF
jgi:hypothetical protein